MQDLLSSFLLLFKNIFMFLFSFICSYFCPLLLQQLNFPSGKKWRQLSHIILSYPFFLWSPNIYIYIHTYIYIKKRIFQVLVLGRWQIIFHYRSDVQSPLSSRFNLMASYTLKLLFFSPNKQNTFLWNKKRQQNHKMCIKTWSKLK